MTKKWGVAVVIVMGAAGIALAESATVDEFKEAVQHQFCDSIPYRSLRGSCKDKGEIRDDYCKKRESSCKNLDPKGLHDKIDSELNPKIEALRKQRDELKDKRSDAKDDDARKSIDEQLSSIEEQLEKLGRLVEEMKGKLDENRRLASDRVDVGQRCIDARNEVTRIFADAKSSARGESDDQIKPLAEQLIRYWESQEPPHAEELDLAQKALERCKAFRDAS